MQLKTDRLIIRKATLEDADFFLKLLNEKDYIENIRDSGVRNIEDAKNYLQNIYLKSYQLNGFGLYVLEKKLDDRPLGICGFVKRDSLEVPDLGFALLKEETNQGYVFESATSLISFAKKTLSFTSIAAITTPSNLRSIKVLEKLGFSLVQKKLLPHSSEELNYYLKSLV